VQKPVTSLYDATDEGSTPSRDTVGGPIA
jgi:hypothetical protein